MSPKLSRGVLECAVVMLQKDGLMIFVIKGGGGRVICAGPGVSGYVPEGMNAKYL